MKGWVLVFSGLVILLGATACNANESPAATSAGFVRVDASATPQNIQNTVSRTSRPVVTETLILTQTPTKTPFPSASLTPIPPTKMTCWMSKGNVEEHQLDSDDLDKPLDYYVYLPPCYTEHSDRHYPVMYLFHGQTYTNQHWIDLGVVDLADHLISNQELAPFIMVFPYDRDHFVPPGKNLFGQVVLFDLIPAIDQMYRTIPTRSARAIGGISRGGNWAAHLGLQNPELFSAIGLHSTPIFSSDTNQEIIEWLEAIPIEEFPRLFLDSGEKDRWLKYTLVFEELLNNASIPHEWHLYPGYHEDDYWEAHLEEYIHWYARSWDLDSSW